MASYKEAVDFQAVAMRQFMESGHPVASAKMLGVDLLSGGLFQNGGIGTMAWKSAKTVEKDKTTEEVFTLTEGTVKITYPAKLSGESIGDLEKYLKIFVEKITRMSDDPHDPVAPVDMSGLSMSGTID